MALGTIFVTILLEVPQKTKQSQGSNLSTKEYPSASDKILPTVVFPEPIIPEFQSHRVESLE